MKTWTTSSARKKFSELLRGSAHEPQAIYNRKDLVAALVDAETFQEFLAWKEERGVPPLEQAFARLRELMSKEEYRLELPDRIDRRNGFTDERE